MCKRCHSTIQEAGPVEDLVVDGEKLGSVNICYLGDTIDGDGERILLQQLTIKVYVCFPRAFTISSSPARDVCQLCKNQYNYRSSFPS